MGPSLVVGDEGLNNLGAVLKVLQGLAKSVAPVTIRDLSARSGVSKSTLYRVLRVLLSRGLVQKRRTKFGGRTIIVLTAKGAEAARYADILSRLVEGGRTVRGTGANTTR